jgi:glycerol kinase
MLMHTGAKPIASRNNLLTTVAWRIGHKTEYALEGSIFIAGAVVQWLRDGLGIINSSSEVEALAAQVEDNGGLYVVPAFAGLGAPHWDQYARGAIVGSREVQAVHISPALHSKESPSRSPTFSMRWKATPKSASKNSASMVAPA